MFKGLIAFIGRLLISILFFVLAAQKVLDWQGSQQLLTNALTNWLTLAAQMPWILKIVEIALDNVALIMAIATICEVLGGLCILLGVQVRFGAFLLIIFLIPTMLLMNPFWTFRGADYDSQLAAFLQNLGILGGLLILLAYGNGRNCSSIPKQQEKSEI